MPTLESLNGRTLGAGIGNLTQNLITQFQGQADRSRALFAAEQAEAERIAKQEAIKKQLGILSSEAPGVDPGFASTAEGDAAMVARASERFRLEKQHQQKQQKALMVLAGIDPTIVSSVKGIMERGDAIEQAELTKKTDQGVRLSSILLAIPDPIKRRAKGLELVKLIAANGGDPRQGLALINMPTEKFNLALLKMNTAGKAIKTLVTPFEQFTTEERGGVPVQISSTTGKEIVSPRVVKPVAAVTGISKPSPKDYTGESLDKFRKSGNFADLELTPEAKAAGADGKGFISTGQTELLPGGGARQVLKDGTTRVTDKEGRILEGEERTKFLAESVKFQLKLARTLSGEKRAGTEAIAQSTKAFTGLQSVKKSLLNIDKAIQAIDDGAKTGPIVSKLPSIRMASVRLDNIQAQMGLDVISTTTFGALSESELAFALSTALPRNLEPVPLRAWLVEKKAAQEKLGNYLEDVAAFLGTPGNTVGDWVKQQKAIREELGLPAAQTPGQGQTVGRFQIVVE